MTASVVLNSRNIVRDRRTHTTLRAVLKAWIQNATSSNVVIDNDTIEMHHANGSGAEDP